jgi:phenylpropionate dioxygenase-like ring-hydroxylating dioxygenase large terminal subunit
MDKTSFKERVKANAGMAQELGGMVWVYVGPRPAPLLPRYDVYVMDGQRDVGHAMLPCNWLQIMENAVDPHHVEWLHGRYFEFLGNRLGVTAAETVFADDQPINVDGARAVGIPAILFDVARPAQSYAGAIALLDAPAPAPAPAPAGTPRRRRRLSRGAGRG